MRARVIQDTNKECVVPREPYRFCHSCGAKYHNIAKGSTEFPCGSCSTVTFRNPIPVSVLLIPHDGGLITIRRSIAPKQGTLALPSGFIKYGESWREAAAREAAEEANVHISDPERSIYDYFMESIPSGAQILLFGIVRKGAPVEVLPFVENEEASERIIIRRNNFDLYQDDIGFSLHQTAIRKYLCT